MERFSPEQRDCYSESEIELKYLPKDHGYRYEMSNCLFEATFEHILEVGKIENKIKCITFAFAICFPTFF